MKGRWWSSGRAPSRRWAGTFEGRQAVEGGSGAGGTALAAFRSRQSACLHQPACVHRRAISTMARKKLKNGVAVIGRDHQPDRLLLRPDQGRSTFIPIGGVPQSIIVNEMLPRLRSDPRPISTRAGYEVTDSKGPSRSFVGGQTGAPMAPTFPTMCASSRARPMRWAS